MKGKLGGLDERQQAKPQPNKHISIKTLDGSTGNSSKCSSNSNTGQQQQLQTRQQQAQPATATWVATFYATATTKSKLDSRQAGRGRGRKPACLAWREQYTRQRLKRQRVSEEVGGTLIRGRLFALHCGRR